MISIFLFLEREQWDLDFIHLTSEAPSRSRRGTVGRFIIGAVDGDLDSCIEKVGEQDRIGFSLVGVDEVNEVSSREWTKLKEGRLRGRIYFHDGEESGFVAGIPSLG